MNRVGEMIVMEALKATRQRGRTKGEPVPLAMPKGAIRKFSKKWHVPTEEVVAVLSSFMEKVAYYPEPDEFVVRGTELTGFSSVQFTNWPETQGDVMRELRIHYAGLMS